MRVIKWLAGGMLALLLLVAATLLVVSLVVDPNDYRDRIVAAVEDQTGRSFDLSGEIGWSVFPTLGVTAGPVSLGNDPAFPGDEFLTARKLAASVQLLPLLRQEIRIGEVVLDGVSVTLLVDEKGRGNWESLAEKASPNDGAESPAPGSEEPLDLAVEALRLVDATIRYEDLGADLRVLLEELSVEISPVAAGEVTSVAVATRYAAAGQAGRFSASLSAEDLLPGPAGSAAPRFTVQRLELVNEEGMRLSVTVDETAVVDLDAGTASLPGLLVSSGAARVRLDAEGSGLPDSPRFSGRFEVPDFDLKSWLREEQLYLEETRDAAAMRNFGIRTDFRFEEGALALSGLEGRLDDSTLSGTATLGDAITFALTLDAIDVDRYLPPATDAPAESEAPGAPAELALGAIDGSLAVGSFRLAGLEATDIRLTVRSDADGLRVEPLEGRLYGGTVRAELALTPMAGRTPAAVDLAVDAVQAGELLGAWMERPILTGTGRFAGKLTLADAFAAEPLGGLDGELSLVFADGALFGINVVGALQQALELAGRGTGEEASGGAMTEFSSFDFAGKIQNGVLRTETFELVSPVLSVAGGGSVDLAASTLDFRLVPEITELPGGKAGGPLASLSGRRIPLTLSGALSAPTVRPDLAGAAESELRDRLGEKLGLGGDEEEEGGAKAVLGGLLRGALERDGAKDDDDDDGGL